MKRYAFAALWLALLAQVLWMLGHALAVGTFGDKALYDGVIVAAFAVLAATGGRVRRLASVARILAGLIFLGSVGDRFGLLGPSGAPGVSWGDLAHFVDYTRAVTAFLPPGWAPVLAGLATLGETALGLALLLGVRPQRAARGAATLILLFGVAMTLSLGPAAPFPYAVWIMVAGAWALATVDASALGVDDLLARRVLRRRPSATRSIAARSTKAAHDGR